MRKLQRSGRIALTMMAAMAVSAPVGLAAAPAAAMPPAAAIIGGTVEDELHGEVQLWGESGITNEFVCGGTLVTSTWVLTAKHCVQSEQIGAFGVRAGTLRLGEGGQIADAIRWIEHDTLDVALLEIEPTEGLVHARLAPRDRELVEESQVFATGWGATTAGDPRPSDVLKVATMEVDVVGDIIEASVVDGVTGRGDSGGPLLQDDLQVGVASDSDEDTEAGFLNVASPVVRDWIAANTGV